MTEPKSLTAIEARVQEDHIFIPQGMTPICGHYVEDRFIAYVQGWTSAGEYEARYLDLYPLQNATPVDIVFSAGGENQNQKWYAGFGVPAKVALKVGDKLTIQDTV